MMAALPFTACLTPTAQSPELVHSPDALVVTAVGGLERTNAQAHVLPSDHPEFDRKLRVTIGAESNETNATQLTVGTNRAVAKGDVLTAEIWVRGEPRPAGRGRPQIEFLFEKSTEPWTKSASLPISVGSTWRRVRTVFRSAETYQPGQAMISIRLAFGPQTVEIGGLKVRNHGRDADYEALLSQAVAGSPLGNVEIRVDRSRTHQTMRGLGGNFCQPRYGSSTAIDAVGLHNLEHLNVIHARIGLPLNHWMPEPGTFAESGPAKASLEALGEMAKRRIPTVVSVWEPPVWMLGGRVEQSGRELPLNRYGDCIRGIVAYLKVAKEKYGAEPEYFSFNEPDYGVNVKMSPQQMATFVRLAGRAFADAGLKTKLLVGDTANGANFVAYARPLLEDRSLAPYLGPLAFHSWDALGIPEFVYNRIRELGHEFDKEIWCLEAGHDAQLWQRPDPWDSWENGLRLAMAYAKTVRASGATLMSYWTYEDNYPLVSSDGRRRFPAFEVIRLFERVLPPGSKVVDTSADTPDLESVATIGPGPRAFSFLVANGSGPGTIALSGLPAHSAVEVVTMAGGSGSETSLSRTDAEGRLRVPIPARGIVAVFGL